MPGIWTPEELKEYERELAKKTVIVTTTFYNPDPKSPTYESDQLREELTIETFNKAIDKGYSIINVDGGSRDEFLKEIDKDGIYLLEEVEKGIGPPRAQGFRKAMELDKYIVAWTEPEKSDYVKRGLIQTVIPIIENKSDLVVPERNSLGSYPLGQQHEELFGNHFWAAHIGKYLDLWFGPKTWWRDLTGFFADYRGEHGDKWCYTFIPILDAMKEGFRVHGVKIPYEHPRAQTEIEERSPRLFNAKRLVQLNNLIQGIESWIKENGPLLKE